jgi:hypothetical protein
MSQPPSDGADRPVAGATPGRRRGPSLRAVAMPAEHGGWGLTLEPGLLGLLVAPSVAGLLLALGALLAFLVRTPLRLLLIGRRRGQRPRTTVATGRDRLARRVALLELTALGIAFLLAAAFAEQPGWWLPALVAAPLFLVALWYDMRSLSRHVVPEIVGSVAIASVAALGALAGGAAWPLASGLWVILAARVVTSIPHVRAQILRIHGNAAPATPTIAGDAAALLTAGAAVLLDAALVVGALAIVGLIAVQRITLLRPPRPARVMGVRQMILGFTVVGATAVGTWVL